MTNKCSNCLQKKSCPYKKGKKRFCSKECKKAYYDNDISTLKKDVQIKFNRIITENQSCAVCGKKFDKMDCSHILSRNTAEHLRFDFYNTLPKCSRCHRWFWHENPLEAASWFKDHYPDRYDYLMFARNLVRGWTVEELHEIRKAIEEKDFQSLIRFKKEWKKK